MHLLDRLRRRGERREVDGDLSRRDFFLRATGASMGFLAAGLLLPADAWAAAEERAARFGIVPGTAVDRYGRPLEGPPIENAFIGTIAIFGFQFAPRDWAQCNGQLVSIAQNTALFSLLGTTYGGNGQSTFGLPDLQGRVAIHQGQGPGLSSRIIGERAGTEQVTLASTQMPAHAHSVSSVLPVAATAGTTPDPTANILAAPASSIPQYAAPAAATGSSAALAGTTSVVGGSQPHSIMQPYLTVNFCIAIAGIFPTQN
jgi:microcystin-dependent protein